MCGAGLRKPGPTSSRVPILNTALVFFGRLLRWIRGTPRPFVWPLWAIHGPDSVAGWALSSLRAFACVHGGRCFRAAGAAVRAGTVVSVPNLQSYDVSLSLSLFSLFRLAFFASVLGLLRSLRLCKMQAPAHGRLGIGRARHVHRNVAQKSIRILLFGIGLAFLLREKMHGTIMARKNALRSVMPLAVPRPASNSIPVQIISPSFHPAVRHLTPNRVYGKPAPHGPRSSSSLLLTGKSKMDPSALLPSALLLLPRRLADNPVAVAAPGAAGTATLATAAATAPAGERATARSLTSGGPPRARPSRGGGTAGARSLLLLTVPPPLRLREGVAQPPPLLPLPALLLMTLVARLIPPRNCAAVGRPPPRPLATPPPGSAWDPRGLARCCRGVASDAARPVPSLLLAPPPPPKSRAVPPSRCPPRP